MIEGDHIPDATDEEKMIYRYQAETYVLPKAGFKNAREVRSAIQHCNKSMKPNEVK